MKNAKFHRTILIAASLIVSLMAGMPMARAQRTVTALSYPGGDLGAQINAADAALGSSPGTIVVSSPGQVSTEIHLAAGHGLTLNSPTHWVVGGRLSGDNLIHCGGQGALLSLELPGRGSLLSGRDVHNVAVDNCWIKAVNPGGGNYHFLFLFHADGVKVTHSHATDITLLHVQTGSTRQADNSDANSSHDVEFSYNYVDDPLRLSTGETTSGVLLLGVIRAQVTHNTFHGMTHGVEYWGGDSNTDVKDKNSPRWVRDVVIADNQCSDVAGSCYWGSMGQNIQYLRNKAERCGDACLDIEGDANDMVDGNTVVDGNLGILMRNNHLEYKNNTVISTHSTEPLIHISNNSPSGENNLDFFIHDNTFQCKDPSEFCNIEFQDVQNLVFDHNMVTNGKMHPYAHEQMGTTITNNTFIYDHSNDKGFIAIDAGWQVAGRSAKVVNNIVQSNAPQPAGSECIHLEWADTGAPSQQYVQGNTCGGRNPIPVDLDMVSNGSRASGVTFHVAGNHFARNQILRSDNTHTATFDIRP